MSDHEQQQQKLISVAVCQFDSKLKQPQMNMEKVARFLSQVDPAKIRFDLFVLPEMAFTGYCFDSREDVDPYAEDVSVVTAASAHRQSDTNTSSSSVPTLDTSSSCYSFVRSIALTYQCMVICGFPEKVVSSDGGDSNNEQQQVKYYNSAYVIDKHGTLLHVYRKHFLYTTDKAWSEPGDSFLSFDTVLGTGSNGSDAGDDRNNKIKLGVGICMDINPEDFIAPWSAFELANYHKKHKSKIIVLCCNWLASPESDDEDEDSEEEEDKEEKQVLNSQLYWLRRLSPLLTPQFQNCYFVCSNRIGAEKDIAFCGSSCVLALGDKPKRLLSFGRREEGIQIVKIPISE